jgi:RimJ/RimL family protein N-acetyltransferase
MIWMKFPPERIELDHADRIVLRRATVDDGEMIARAVAESAEHLHRFMAWSLDPQSLDPVFQRERLARLMNAWERGEEFQFVLCPSESDQVFLAAVGLMTRLGPGTLEFGYWVHAKHEGKGYIMAACAALVAIALEMDGIEKVYICCDPENTRSMVIPKALGFSDDGAADHPVCGLSRMFSKLRTREVRNI